MANEFIIRQMIESDIEGLAHIFGKWHKFPPQFERYFHLHQLGKRVVLVAVLMDDAIQSDGPSLKDGITGYTNLVWETEYEPFRQEGVPEIVDLNVMTEYQRRGIGSALIAEAEDIAREHGKHIIGISVSQSPGFEDANRLYPQLGYTPDGRGITVRDNELHLIKNLT